MSKSEFGRGCAYCLALFLAHIDRYYEMRNQKKENPAYKYIFSASMWFYGAGDHIIDMEIPIIASKSLRKRLMSFKKRVLRFRFAGLDADEKVTDKDIEKCLKEAKLLLLRIDRELLCINATRGGCE